MVRGRDGVPFPMAVVSGDFVDGSCADLLTNQAQFSAMLLNRIFEDGFLLAVPVSVDPASFVLLPLERGVSRNLSRGPVLCSLSLDDLFSS